VRIRVGTSLFALVIKMAVTNVDEVFGTHRVITWDERVWDYAEIGGRHNLAV
jgi:hypothetical protein